MHSAWEGRGSIVPPHSFEGRVTDSAFFAWNTAGLLHEQGVTVALSGHGSAGAGERLARQPGFAMRGGMPFQAALESVTAIPARLAGVSDRVGTLESGKDGDVVLWDGPPFELSSQIIGVLVGGRLVVDPRPAEEDE